MAKVNLNVPITGEILEKNGFVRSEVFEEWKFNDDDIEALWKPFPFLSITSEEGSVKSCNCETVADLKWAFHLCGYEKDFVL